MSRVGAGREREGTIPRATAVPRLAKPARHAGYAPGAHRSIGGCRRSGEGPSLRRAGQASHRGVGGAGVPRLSRRLSPAATCDARGSPSVPLSRPASCSPGREATRGKGARAGPAIVRLAARAPRDLVDPDGGLRELVAGEVAGGELDELLVRGVRPRAELHDSGHLFAEALRSEERRVGKGGRCRWS